MFSNKKPPSTSQAASVAVSGSGAGQTVAMTAGGASAPASASASASQIQAQASGLRSLFQRASSEAPKSANGGLGGLGGVAGGGGSGGRGIADAGDYSTIVRLPQYANATTSALPQASAAVVNSPEFRFLMSHPSCHMASLVLGAELPTLEPIWIDDLANDVHNLIDPADNEFDNESTGGVAASPVCYPHGQMSAASIVELHPPNFCREKEDITKDDLERYESLIEVLMASYRGINRTDEAGDGNNNESNGKQRMGATNLFSSPTGHHQQLQQQKVQHMLEAKKKVTFITFDGRPSVSLEFITDRDYWLFLYAIRKVTYLGLEVEYVGPCLVNSNQIHAAASAAAGAQAAAAGSFIARVAAAATGGVSGASDSTKHTVTVSDGRLQLFEGVASINSTQRSILSIDLSDIRSMAITVDSEPAKKYLLEVAVLPESDANAPLDPHTGSPEQSNNVILQFVKKTVDGVGAQDSHRDHHWHAASLSPVQLPGRPLFLPLTAEDIQRCSLVSGIEDEDMDRIDWTNRVRSLPFSIALFDGRNRRPQQEQGHLMAEHVIPYAGMINLPSPPQLTSNTTIASDQSEEDLESSLRVANPIYIKVILQSSFDIKRALRVCIHHAVDLPCSAKAALPPTAYCTIYLVDAKHEKLSVNTMEMRTETIAKQACPEWDAEFLLQGPASGTGDGTDGIHGVMVTVRDAASGILKHAHLGQVVIPINCFIYRTEAQFILPLEPTYRMSASSMAYLGEIKITTELVAVEDHVVSSLASDPTGTNGSGAPSSSTVTVAAMSHLITPKFRLHGLGGFGGLGSPAAVPVGASGSVSSSGYTGSSTGLTIRKVKHEAQLRTSTLTYTLLPVADARLWWPFKAFSGQSWSSMLSASTTVPMAGQTSQTGVSSGGYCQFSHKGMLMLILPGSGGPLTHCKENDRRPAVGATAPYTRVFVPWSELRGVLAVTDAVLMVTVAVHPLPVTQQSQQLTGPPSTPLATSSSSRSSFISSPPPQLQTSSPPHEAICDLLVAPCPATHLQAVVSDRKSVLDIRSAVTSFHSFLRATACSDGADVGIFATPDKPDNRSSFDRPSSGSNKERNSNTIRLSLSRGSTTSPTAVSSPAGSSVASVSPFSIHQPPQTPSHTTSRLGGLGVGSGKYPTTPMLTLANGNTNASTITNSNVLPPSSTGNRQRGDSISALLSSPGKPQPNSNNNNSTSKGISYFIPPSLASAVGNLTGNTSALLLQEARPVFQMVEQLVAELTDTTDANSTTTLNAMDVRKRRRLRVHLYGSFLLYLCNVFTSDGILDDGADVPVYTVDYVHKVLDHDSKEALILQPLRPGASASSLTGRHEHIYEMALSRLRSFLLCSGRHWDAFLQPISTGNGSSNNNTDSVRCVEELLNGFNNALRLSLFPFCNSEDSFKAIAGLEMKTAVLHLVVKHNYRLHTIANSLLAPLGLALSSNTPLVLLPHDKLDKLVGWYRTWLTKETKTWLSRTLSNAHSSKGNAYDFPWDIETIGDSHGSGSAGRRYISPLPETLRFQMNVYWDAIMKPVNEPHNGHSPSPSDGTLGFYELSMHPSEIGFTAKVNELVIAAVGQCWKLLADEYSRAVQSKHWELLTTPSSPRHSSNNNTINANVHFLAAVCNDAHRIVKSHLQPFREYASDHSVRNVRRHGHSRPGVSGHAADDYVKLVSTAFSDVRDQALHKIVRIAFSELTQTLVDFDELWTSDAGDSVIAKTLCSALASLFRELRGTLEDSDYMQCINNCLKVCVMRYLVFLRTQAVRAVTAPNRFGASDITKLTNDVELLKRCFQDATAATAASGAEVDDVLKTQLSYLFDVIELLSLPAQSEPFTTLVKTIVCRYLRLQWQHSSSSNEDVHHSTGSNKLHVRDTTCTQREAKTGIAVVVMFAVALRPQSNSISNTSDQLEKCITAIVNECETELSRSFRGGHTSIASLLGDGSASSLPNMDDIFVRLIGLPNTSIEDLCDRHYDGHGHGDNTVPGGLNKDRDSGKPAALIRRGSVMLASAVTTAASTLSTAHSTSSLLSTNTNANIGSSKQLLGLNVKQLLDRLCDAHAHHWLPYKRKNDEYASQVLRSVGLHTAADRAGEFDLNRAVDIGHPVAMSSRPSDANLDNHSVDGSAVPDDASSCTGGGSEFNVGSHSHNHISDLKTNDASESHPFDCTITVSQLKVTGLKPGSVFSMSRGHNAYVALSIGAQRLKSSVKASHGSSNAAEWPGALFTFKAYRSRLNGLKLQVRVYDKELVRRKVPLGAASVALAGLDIHTIDSSFALEGGPVGSNAAVHLHIHMDEC